MSELEQLLAWLRQVESGEARYEDSNMVLVGQALQADLIRCSTDLVTSVVTMQLSWRGRELLDDDTRLREEATAAAGASGTSEGTA